MDLPATVNSIEGLTLPARPLHLAIGMFDGVHLGHQSVIQTAIKAARESGGIAAVLTFWPHPSALFRPEDPVPQIMTPDLKDRVLRSLGVDLIIEQAFTLDFASIPAAELLLHLKKHLPQLSSIYVGENWRFGKGRKGDIRLLTQLGHESGIHVNSAPRLNHSGEPISSTRIRSLLADGDIATANALLGFNYFSETEILAGKKLGRTLGFPTLNLPWAPPLMPRFGVYVVKVGNPEGNPDESLAGVANYGIRPTVETATDPTPLLEVFLLDNSCPWKSGDRVHVEWLQFLRPEQRFSSTDDLKRQIAQDVEEARRFL